MKDITEEEEPDTTVEEEQGGILEEAPQSGHARRRLWVVIAMLVAMALVLGGVWGWNVHRSRLLDEARAGCATASDVLRVDMNRYSTLLDGDATMAGGITAKQVLDPKTVDTLKSALNVDEPTLVSCTATDTQGLNRATKGIERNSKWYGRHMKSLNIAVKAVNDSKAAKILADAKTALKGSLDQAKSLLASSDGKVADNATRETLTTAIDKAGQVYAAKDVKDAKDAKDAKKYDDARTTLEQAMKSVNDSMASRQADDEAAAAAAEAQTQAAQQQQSYTPSYGGSGATQQQQATPAQPSTPSAPSTGGGSTSTGGGTGIDLTPGDRLPGDGNCIVFGDCG
jgi:hypothetical protein